MDLKIFLLADVALGEEPKRRIGKKNTQKNERYDRVKNSTSDTHALPFRLGKMQEEEMDEKQKKAGLTCASQEKTENIRGKLLVEGCIKSATCVVVNSFYYL